MGRPTRCTTITKGSPMSVPAEPGRHATDTRTQRVVHPLSVADGATAAMVPRDLYTDRALADSDVRLWCLLDTYPADGYEIRERAALDLDCSRQDVDRSLARLRKAGWLR